MKVRSMVGRHYGEIVDMPYHVAQACLANGTALHPDAPVKVRGAKAIEPEKDAEAVEVNRMMTSDIMQTKRAARRKHGKNK